MVDTAYVGFYHLADPVCSRYEGAYEGRSGDQVQIPFMEDDLTVVEEHR